MKKKAERFCIILKMIVSYCNKKINIFNIFYTFYGFEIEIEKSLFDNHQSIFSIIFNIFNENSIIFNFIDR